MDDIFFEQKKTHGELITLLTSNILSTSKPYYLSRGQIYVTAPQDSTVGASSIWKNAFHVFITRKKDDAAPSVYLCGFCLATP